MFAHSYFVLFHEFFFFKQKTAYEIGLGIPAEPLFRSSSLFLRSASISGLRRDAVQPDIEAERKKRDQIEAGKVTVADVLAAEPVTTNLLKFKRASIKMICVSNLESFIASMTQKLN